MSESHKAESPSSEPEAAIWEYRPLQECSLPPVPGGERLKKGVLATLWGHWSSRRQPETEPPSLNPIADLQLQRIAASPDAADKLPALRLALEDWVNKGSQKSPTAVLVQGPFGDESEVARQWAEAQQWDWVNVAREDNGSEAFAAMEAAKAPLVVTQFQAAFVRSVDSFQRYEQLLLARERSNQPMLLVVDRWSWHLLRSVMPFIGYWPQWALQPLDAASLERWLKQLMSGGYRQQRFLQASNQRPLFAVDLEEKQEQSRYLQHLAAESRGDPAVILARWRGALRQTLSDDGSDDAKANDDEAEAAGIWVQAWPNPDWPSQSGRVRDELVLLYGIVQHGGIVESDLPAVCSSTPSRVMSTLRALQSRNIVRCSEGVWRLNPLAYPLVRKTLLSESFLCDGED